METKSDGNDQVWVEFMCTCIISKVWLVIHQSSLNSCVSRLKHVHASLLNMFRWKSRINLMIRKHNNQIHFWLQVKSQFQSAIFKSMGQAAQEVLWHHSCCIWNIPQQTSQYAKKGSIWWYDLKVIHVWNQEKHTGFWHLEKF